MDDAAIDQAYQQLQDQSGQTIAALTALAGKLQAAGQAGDQNAREWQLDLREVALGVQSEQNQVTALLQAIHAFVAEHAASAAAPQPAAASPQQGYPSQQGYPQQGYPQQGYPQQQGYPRQNYPGSSPGQYGAAGAGAMVGRFLTGGFGQAMISGAGFGIADDLVNHLFRH